MFQFLLFEKLRKYIFIGLQDLAEAFSNGGHKITVLR